jgi:hypothetical protein
MMNYGLLFISILFLVRLGVTASRHGKTYAFTWNFPMMFLRTAGEFILIAWALHWNLAQ